MNCIFLKSQNAVGWLVGKARYVIALTDSDRHISYSKWILANAVFDHGTDLPNQTITLTKKRI